MDYQLISQNHKQFLSLTSIEVREFEQILEPFSRAWAKYYSYHTLEGKFRKHPKTKEHGNATLKGTAQKLFFLLVYLKTNALQEYQAASFGVSQSKVSRIVRTLLTILDQSLDKMGYSPKRIGNKIGRPSR